LLGYHRPLVENGVIEYDFFYEPGETAAHPALDRLAFILAPQGVRIHWITDDRYDRLLVDEERESTTFHLRGSERAEPVAVGGSLSTGTREQAYLALRLAVLSHLDRGGERLPVFLDEALVNWDRRRRRGAIALLAERSRERQLFLFTCHEPIAEEMQEHGARLHRLPRPDAE